ncbi:hypothetical protein HNP46_000051 [Pseudomonas nitritireducens]|uniref:Lipoprotein n=1 Tax=Pseudomonas nitroreducens TaxID=46680 RepID=A0A7W7KEW5_PSENT|nr:hypothetical protein [Pseudomonas nitritireducens]MBB4861240.1 hypothetical protein [Pseudomonas nitritireducens]
MRNIALLICISLLAGCSWSNPVRCSDVAGATGAFLSVMTAGNYPLNRIANDSVSGRCD